MGFSPILLSFQGYCIVYEEKEVMFQTTHICDILLSIDESLPGNIMAGLAPARFNTRKCNGRYVD